MTTPRVTTSKKKARNAALIKKAVSNAAAGVMVLGMFAAGGHFINKQKSAAPGRKMRTLTAAQKFIGLTDSFCRSTDNYSEICIAADFERARLDG